jgi:hypothetical protein
LNDPDLCSINIISMASIVASTVRVFLAMAMSFGFAAMLPAGDCRAPAMSRACGCCVPGAASCCAAPEDRSPAPQPAGLSSRVSEQFPPSALPQREMPRVFPSLEKGIFPVERMAACPISAGRSFQSVICVWTV